MQPVSPDGVLEVEGAESAVIDLDILVPQIAMDDAQITAVEVAVFPFDPRPRLQERPSVIVTELLHHPIARKKNIWLAPGQERLEALCGEVRRRFPSLAVQMQPRKKLAHLFQVGAGEMVCEQPAIDPGHQHGIPRVRHAQTAHWQHLFAICGAHDKRRADVCVPVECLQPGSLRSQIFQCAPARIRHPQHEALACLCLYAVQQVCRKGVNAHRVHIDIVCAQRRCRQPPDASHLPDSAQRGEVLRRV